MKNVSRYGIVKKASDETEDRISYTVELQHEMSLNKNQQTLVRNLEDQVV